MTDPLGWARGCPGRIGFSWREWEAKWLQEAATFRRKTLAVVFPMDEDACRAP